MGGPKCDQCRLVRGVVVVCIHPGNITKCARCTKFGKACTFQVGGSETTTEDGGDFKDPPSPPRKRVKGREWCSGFCVIVLIRWRSPLRHCDHPDADGGFRALRLAIAEFSDLLGSYNARATERSNADAQERALLVLFVGKIVSAACEAAHDFGAVDEFDEWAKDPSSAIWPSSPLL